MSGHLSVPVGLCQARLSVRSMVVPAQWRRELKPDSEADAREGGNADRPSFGLGAEHGGAVPTW